MLIVNASSTDKDLAHFAKYLPEYECTVTNITDTYSSIAVQGPDSEKILKVLSGPKKNDLNELDMEGHTVRVSKTGYTGDPIGWVTSGTMVPYYQFDENGQILDKTGKRSIGFAYIDADVTLEDVIEIDVRGKRLKAHRVAKHMDQNTPPYGRAIVQFIRQADTINGNTFFGGNYYELSH